MVMPTNNNQQLALNKLNNAIENFALLKKNQVYFDVRQQLKYASVIRDRVVKDALIKTVCEEDALLANKREQLFLEIKDFQQQVINSVISNYEYDEEIKYDEQFDFNAARNKLIQLVDEEIDRNNQWSDSAPDVISLMEKYPQHMDSLYEVVDRCKNDKFIVLLMGEYQSGKTTTLNALCEGKQIGAIGRGEKTSAVPLAVSYSDKNNIEIKWKTKNDFEDIFVHLKLYYQNIDFQSIDIDNPEVRRELLEKIDDLRKNIHGVDVKDHQFIVLSSMILKYWDSDELLQIKNDDVGIDAIGLLTKFPEKMYSRWTKDGVSCFSAMESAFVFIKQVDCYCDSRILKETNCIFMDCPGLFANAYDTQVTVNAMKEADAILYLLPRDKQTGSQIEESLAKLKNEYRDLACRKLVIANNISLTDVNRSTIIEANMNNIKRLFGDDFNVIPFDARAAYIMRIKEAFDAHQLDDSSIMNFINSNPSIDSSDILGVKTKVFNSFEEAWDNCAREYVGRNNNFDQLISKLISFVEKNKAASIIISKGANRLAKELSCIQNDLKISSVEPYAMNRVGLESEWDKRFNDLEQFEKEAKSIVHQTLFGSPSSVYDRLSDAIYSKLFMDEIYESMADRICDRMYANVEKLKKLEKKKDELKEFTEQLVSGSITDVIMERVLYWNNLMVSDQDVDFLTIFSPAVDSMEVVLSSKWKERFCNDPIFKQSMYDYYHVLKDTKTFAIRGAQQNENAKVKQGEVTAAIALDYVGLAVGVAGFAGFIAVLLLAATPLGLLFGAVVSLGAGLFGWGTIDDYREKRFKKKVKPDLMKQLKECGLKVSIKNMISAEVKRLLEIYENGMKVDFEKAKRTRDVALATLDDPNLESNCFKAIGAIDLINKQIERYNAFVSSL